MQLILLTLVVLAYPALARSGGPGRQECDAACPTCLVFDSNVNGVCSSFGGFYIFDGAGACSLPNYYSSPTWKHPRCECTRGYQERCFSLVDKQRFCVCAAAHFAAGAAFGGVYQSTAAGEACSPNDYTGGCSCPEGYGPSTYLPGLLDSHGNATFVVFCVPLLPVGAHFPTDALAVYAGGFSRNPGVSSCSSGNPLVANSTCDCPSLNLTATDMKVSRRSFRTGNRDVTLCLVSPEAAYLGVSINQNGMEAIGQGLFSVLGVLLQNTTFPTISDTVDVFGFKVTFSLSELRPAIAQAGKIEVVSEGNVWTVGMRGASLSASAAVSVKSILGDVSRTVTITLSDFSLAARVTLDAPVVGGRVDLQIGTGDVGGIVVQVGHVKTHFNASLWDKPVLTVAVEEAVSKALEDLCNGKVLSTLLSDVLVDAVAAIGASGVLDAPPMHLALVGDLELDLSAAGEQIPLEHSGVILPLRALFFANHSATGGGLREPIYPYAPLPREPAIEDFGVTISDSMINSLFDVLYADDHINGHLTTLCHLLGVNCSLSTHSLLVAGISNEIPQKFPNATVDVLFQCTPELTMTHAPEFTTSPVGVTVSFAFVVTMVALTHAPSCRTDPTCVYDATAQRCSCTLFTSTLVFHADVFPIVSADDKHVSFSINLLFADVTGKTISTNVGPLAGFDRFFDGILLLFAPAINTLSAAHPLQIAQPTAFHLSFSLPPVPFVPAQHFFTILLNLDVVV